MEVSIKKNINSQAGSSLLAALIVLGVASAAIFTGMDVILDINKKASDLKSDLPILNLRNNIQALLTNKEAWEQTYNSTANTFVDCQQDFTQCQGYVLQAKPFNLLGPSGNTIVTNMGSYFDKNGRDCQLSVNPDSLTNTVNNCLYKVNLYWKPLCSFSDNNCSQIQLTADFYKNLNGTDQVLLGYQLNVIKNFQLGVLSGGGSTLTKAVTLPATEQPPIKVILILDPSASMSTKFPKVTDGIKNLLSNLGSYNIQVYFYTTASLALPYSTFSSTLDFEFRNWNIYTVTGTLGNQFYFPGFQKVSIYDIVESERGSSIANPDYFEAVLKPDFSAQLGLPVNTSLSQTTIDTRVTRIFEEYTPEPGSDQESGFCSITRMAYEEGPNKIIESGDLVYFLVFSDEDDFQLMDAYNSRLHCEPAQQLEDNSLSILDECNPQSEICDFADILYNFQGTWSAMHYEYLDVDTVRSGTGFLCGPISTPVSACPYTQAGSIACDANALTQVIMPPGATLLNCSVTTQINFTTTNAGITSVLDPSFFSPFSDIYTDCEKTFDYSGTTYSGASDYANTHLAGENYIGCEMRYSKNVSTTTQHSYDVTYSGAVQSAYDNININDLIQNTRDRLDSILTSDGYAIQLFIQDSVTDPSCPATGTDGVKYKNMLTFFKHKGYDSICAPDYTVPFSTLSNKITNTVSNTVVFTNLAVTDKIDAITLTRSGAPVPLLVTDYSINGNAIIFQSGIIQNGDVIIAQVSPI